MWESGGGGEHGMDLLALGTRAAALWEEGTQKTVPWGRARKPLAKRMYPRTIVNKTNSFVATVTISRQVVSRLGGQHKYGCIAITLLMHLSLCFY